MLFYISLTSDMEELPLERKAVLFSQGTRLANTEKVEWKVTGLASPVRVDGYNLYETGGFGLPFSRGTVVPAVPVCNGDTLQFAEGQIWFEKDFERILSQHYPVTSTTSMPGSLSAQDRWYHRILAEVGGNKVYLPVSGAPEPEPIKIPSPFSTTCPRCGAVVEMGELHAC